MIRPLPIETLKQYVANLSKTNVFLTILFMSYLQALMDIDLCLRSSRKKRRKYTELELKIKEANYLFIQNNLDECIATAKEVLSKFPKCDRAYFLLGLVFEEQKDLIKAYNFYLIAAQLMKINYELWDKLYALADKLNLLSDKFHFIHILQRDKNTREIVLEKIRLCKILKYKYKAIESAIELFEFDGVDFEIFDKIRKETRHKLWTSTLALALLKLYKKHPNLCVIEFLMNCIRLQYESGYLIGTKNTLESQVFPFINMIPNDIRIIYIVCCISHVKPNGPASIFKYNYGNEEILDETYEKGDFNYNNLSDTLFTTSKSILNEFKASFGHSKTLKLDTFEQPEVLLDQEKYNKYSDLDLFIDDKTFWANFKEEAEIKPLVEVLLELKFLDYTTKLLQKLLDISEPLKEFCIYNLGEIAFLRDELSMAASYFEQVLRINPDNTSVKLKLYDVYSKLDNKDMLNQFKTVRSLINYVDDMSNKSKEEFRFSFEDCEAFRNIYNESRKMFGIDFREHLKISKPLVDDFLKNNFIFVSCPKFRRLLTYSDRKSEGLSLLNVAPDDENRRTLVKDNVRHLSLHGLNSDEWFYVILEHIISKIKNKNYAEASFLLRKCFQADIFIQRKDLLTVFFFLSIGHSIFNNDLSLLSLIFKKSITLYSNYNLSHFYFYLLNYFVEPLLSNSCSMLLRNIRRNFARRIFREDAKAVEGLCDSVNDLSSEDCETSQEEIETISSGYKVDTLCFLNTFINRTVSLKRLKAVKNIKTPLTLNEEMLKSLLYALACKSRNNFEKDDTIKKSLAGLIGLLKETKGESKFVIMYNIGKVYDMMGLVGYAERYYKEAYQTNNRELKALTRLNLIIIYKKSGNLVLLDKYYNDDAW